MERLVTTYSSRPTGGHVFSTLLQVDFYLLSKCLANHVISVCVLFCAQYCLDPYLMTVSHIHRYMFPNVLCKLFVCM